MSNENYLNNPNLFKAHTKKEYTDMRLERLQSVWMILYTLLKHTLRL